LLLARGRGGTVALKVRLSDGITVAVNEDLEDFRKKYQRALAENTLLDVTNGSGKTRVLNPQQILYFEEAEESLTVDVDRGERRAAPAA
jgi:hypothetical protein